MLVSCVGFLVLSASACLGQTPQPTPDPFAGLSQQADEAFQQGLDAYEKGDYREALNQFERARILSPQTEDRIEQMIERSRAALAPTPTVSPPTATPVTPPATATPVFMSRATPDADLGTQYFGSVFLSVVPGRNIVPPPMNEFFYEDQIGLYIDGLNQRLRLPFTIRVFDLDTGALIANVRNEGAVPTGVATRAARVAPTVGLTPTIGTPVPGVTPAPGDFHIARFWDNFVWYHEGGERPGRYRVELYSNDTLTHAFDYLVGNVPVPIPIQPTIEPVPEAPPAAPSAPGGVEGKPEQPGGEPPVPTPTPMPTPTATPQSAISNVVGGIPASMDINLNTRKVYLLDASGVISTIDRGIPTLDKPFTPGRVPVDIAVDQMTGNLYVSARSEPSVMVLSGTTGQSLGTITLPVNPGEVRIDSTLGMLYVLLPDRQAMAMIDVRSNTIVRTTTGLTQTAGLAVDRNTHTVYAVSLGGQLSVLDGRTGQLTARFSISTAGISGLATANGLVFTGNVATRELVIADPATHEVRRVFLNEEPGAVAAGETSGTVYVLGTRSNSILRFDAATGASLGSVLLPERSGNFGVRLPTEGDFQTQRARILLVPGDETLFITQPGSGFLSMVTQQLFPRVGSAPQSAALFANVPSTPRSAAATPTPTRGVTPTGSRTAVASPSARPGQVTTGTPQPPSPETFAAMAAVPMRQASLATAAPTRPPTATPRPTPRPTPTLVPTRDVGAMAASAASPMPAGLEWELASGRFFTQANGAPLGASMRGFALLDSGQQQFWSIYQQMGGVQALGYPTSQRFTWRGHTVQLTQRGLLQWSPATREMSLANLMDELHDRGWDDQLLREQFVPKQLSNEGEAGLSFAQVLARRMTLLDADPALKERYLASPNYLEELGLPTSRVTDLGPVIALRTQKTVLYRWKTPQPWARAGDVTVGLSGDIARQLGLFGDSTLPFQPADAPFDPGQEHFAIRPSEEDDLV